MHSLLYIGEHVDVPPDRTIINNRRVATCKPGKLGLTSFSEALALFSIRFLSFRKMKVRDR